MQIKIISDGMVAGTRVVDAKTGEEIEGVTFIRWELSVNGVVATAELKFINVPVEAVGEFSPSPLYRSLSKSERP